MAREEDVSMWEISMRGVNEFWKEEKSSNCFQEIQNGIGYVDPEESTWSENLDSAESVFPPSTLTPTLDLDIWGEIYQGVSSWCPKPLQDTSSTMVGDRKGSNCIVQDHELNTPERGVQPEFNCTSPSGVTGTSSPFLSDWEGWEISAPLNLLQVSSVEEDKSVTTVKKSDSDNQQCKPTNEFFVDETWRLSVSHEEERVSSHNQEGLNHEGFVLKGESHNMKTSVNTYELEHGVKVMDFGSCESALKASLIDSNKTGTSENTNIQIQSLGSLLGPNFNVMPVDNGIFSVHINQQQAETNLSLKNLPSGSIYHSDTNVGDEIRTADETRRVDRITNDVMNTTVLAKSQVASPMKADTHLMSQIMEHHKTFRENKENGTATSMLRPDIFLKMGEQPKPVNCKETETPVLTEILANSLPSVNSEPSVLMNLIDEVTGGGVHVFGPQSAVMEGNVAKRDLELDLATQLGTDEIISTPVILESLLTQDESFDLVSYIFGRLEPDTTLPASVDFVAETSGTQWNDAEPECMEAERECNQFSSSLELLGKQNQQCEEGTQTNVRRGLEGKDEHFPKARQSRKESEAHTSFKSVLLQDGPTLKLKIFRTKPATSTKVLSSRKSSPRVNISGLEDLLLPKETCGHQAKRVYPSTSKEKISSGSRSRKRELSTSVADESWTPPLKRSRKPSVHHTSDQYRELRNRNNEASRKSRNNRKAREGEMEELAAKLEQENESLKIRVDGLEQLVKKLRDALLEAVAKPEIVMHHKNPEKIGKLVRER